MDDAATATANRRKPGSKWPGFFSREAAFQCNDLGNRHVTVSHDITRAKERAAALQAATGCATVPTVAATVIPEPQRAQAEAEGVRVFLLVHQ